MTDTTKLPPSEREAFEAFAQNCPMGKYSITRRGDGYDSSHTQLMWDAWKARAQVQGVPFGYIHHFVAHDDSGAIIDTTWEADGCADPLPHPTFPSMWKWSHATPFYTTLQPAQATQTEVTDDVSLDERFRDWIVTIKDAHDNSLDGEHASSRSMLRGVIYEMEEACAILALRPVQVPMTCHCQTCRPITITDMRMVLCPKCGNKRCPHANDHRNACTGSNEPGQPGSAYPAHHGITAQAKKEGA